MKEYATFVESIADEISAFKVNQAESVTLEEIRRASVSPIDVVLMYVESNNFLESGSWKGSQRKAYPQKQKKPVSILSRPIAQAVNVQL